MFVPFNFLYYLISAVEEKLTTFQLKVFGAISFKIFNIINADYTQPF